MRINRLRSYLLRWTRLSKFILGGYRGFFLYRQERSTLEKMIYWCCDAGLLLGDVLGFPDLYQMIEVAILTVDRRAAKELPAFSIPYPAMELSHSVRFHASPHVRPNPSTRAYVSFWTINYWGQLDPPTFLHELMHVWQFQAVGSIYIHHALRAQRMVPAYDYGSVDEILERWDTIDIWRDLNFEQMASLGADLQIRIREVPADIRAKNILDQFLTNPIG
ncbi:MAG: hypothetical protein KDC57_09220 [Saprospiraceae bacterium]|nr:hypothetical protein [Saprospiraceae bacterium]